MNTHKDFKIKKMSPLFLVADVKRSIEFYTKKLDFEVDFLYDDFYAGIIKENYSIHLKVSEGVINKSNNEHIHITFAVDSIEDLYKELTNKSLAVIQPPRDMPYGKEFYILDPDGNIISFLE